MVDAETEDGVEAAVIIAIGSEGAEVGVGIDTGGTNEADIGGEAGALAVVGAEVAVGAGTETGHS